MNIWIWGKRTGSTWKFLRWFPPWMNSAAVCEEFSVDNSSAFHEKFIILFFCMRFLMFHDIINLEIILNNKFGLSDK